MAETRGQDHHYGYGSPLCVTMCKSFLLFVYVVYRQPPYISKVNYTQEIVSVALAQLEV